jgi:signal transduction histidine kinase
MSASDDFGVLVVSPFGRDAELIRAALVQSRLQCESLKDVAAAAEVLRSRNVGALLLAAESIGKEDIAILAKALAEQPSWSDLPVLVMTPPGKQTLTDCQREQRYLPLGQITLLERPMRTDTLVSSVKAALHARKRQYEHRLADETFLKSEKLAVAGNLASSIAHEINNPLEAVTNLLYLLNGTSLNQQQQYYLEVARAELARVSAIAVQTLTFSPQREERRQASVSEILDSVLTLYQARLTGSNIAIERRYQHTAPLMCYPGDLRQVFLNLIGNAFDATRNGGRIILGERAVVHPRTGQRGVRILVADTGCGMSAAVKAHLFGAFNSSKGIQGIGLGLWISKEIIDKHRGSIRVRSKDKPGSGGTVFSIFLPRDARGAIEAPLPLLDKAA